MDASELGEILLLQMQSLGEAIRCDERLVRQLQLSGEVLKVDLGGHRDTLHVCGDHTSISRRIHV